MLALLNAEGPRPAYEQLVSVAPDVMSVGDVELTIDIVEAAACVLSGLGRAVDAATVLAAADVSRESAGIPRSGPDQQHLDRHLAAARDALGRADWEQGYAAGATMTPDQVVQWLSTPALAGAQSRPAADEEA